MGTVGLSSWILPGCQSLDRLFLGEYREDAERVTIVGGGLAGLTAAFQLKKKQIPFQIFEASNRIGGRVLSVPEFLTGQPVAELGAEWFSVHHKFVLDLAKELRLDVFETKDIKPRYRKGDKFPSLGEFSKELTRIQKGIRKDPDEMNNVNLAEWVKAQTQDLMTYSLINEWSLLRYGVPAGKITAGVFTTELKGSPNGLGPWLDQRYRLRNGMGSMTDALFERVSGFQPERSFAFKHRLRSVRLLKRGYELNFETPSGGVSTNARAVICTIPVTCLKGIEGIQEFPGPWDSPDEFMMGSHAKSVISFSSRFWVPTLENARIHLFSSGQTIWESSYKQNPLFQFRQGIITSQVGGEAAKKVGPETNDAIKAELQKIFKAPANTQILDEASTNWGANTLFQGSVAIPCPGRRNQLWKSQLPGWQWAGDYVSDKWRGTLNGAIETATAAVEAIAKVKTVR